MSDAYKGKKTKQAECFLNSFRSSICTKSQQTEGDQYPMTTSDLTSPLKNRPPSSVTSTSYQVTRTSYHPVRTLESVTTHFHVLAFIYVVNITMHIRTEITENVFGTQVLPLNPSLSQPLALPYTPDLIPSSCSSSTVRISVYKKGKK